VQIHSDFIILWSHLLLVSLATVILGLPCEEATLDTRKQAEGKEAATGAAAKKAALFATFYVPRAKAPPLHQQLQALIQEPNATADNGSHFVHDARIEVVDPPADHDIKVVRLILSAEGDTATAWENMEQELKRILSSSSLPTDWWGYTVIYQAVLDEGTASTRPSCNYSRP
jgi:hypothetical protein